MGDTARFADLLRSIVEMESDGFRLELADKMAREVKTLIDRTFETATAPDGEVWAPRKLAQGRVTPPHLPLQLTRAMREGFEIYGHTDGVSVENAVVSPQGAPYPAFHQSGTRKMVARRTLPAGDDLGTWEEPLRATAMAHVAGKLNDK